MFGPATHMLLTGPQHHDRSSFAGQVCAASLRSQPLHIVLRGCSKRSWGASFAVAARGRRSFDFDCGCPGYLLHPILTSDFEQLLRSPSSASCCERRTLPQRAGKKADLLRRLREVSQFAASAALSKPIALKRKPKPRSRCQHAGPGTLRWP